MRQHFIYMLQINDRNIPYRLNSTIWGCVARCSWCESVNGILCSQVTHQNKITEFLHLHASLERKLKLAALDNDVGEIKQMDLKGIYGYGQWKSIRCSQRKCIPNMPFLVTMTCLGCSSTGKERTSAATSSAVFHFANWPNRFWPAHTLVWMILRKSWPERGLKMKIAPSKY